MKYENNLSVYEIYLWHTGKSYVKRELYTQVVRNINKIKIVKKATVHVIIGLIASVSIEESN